MHELSLSTKLARSIEPHHGAPDNGSVRSKAIPHAIHLQRLTAEPRISKNPTGVRHRRSAKTSPN